MALSDELVQKQIKQMMAFIEQEANEKAEEIDAKAEEEFNIEKGRLVQQQRLKIMEYYERKEKQVEMQKKIQSSNFLNQSRLKVLQTQENHIKSVLEETSKKLSEVVNDKEKYRKILTALILQGLFQLLEVNVTVKYRKQDLQLVSQCLDEAVKEYNKAFRKQCHPKLDDRNCLPSHLCGGIELVAQEGRIKCVNTLDSRLSRISQQVIPNIRTRLFGPNLNRKFMD